MGVLFVVFVAMGIGIIAGLYERHREQQGCKRLRLPTNRQYF